MLLLRRMGLCPENQQAKKACQLLLDRGFYEDEGINYFASLKHSETCVTGMILSLLAYFHFPDDRIHKLANHLLHQQMQDGGWNCRSYEGDTHSSFHTTINVLEALREYEKYFPAKADVVRASQEKGQEFLFAHRLFCSHRSGEIFDPKMTRFSFPPRWRYDIMRMLDYLQECNASRDERASEAVEIIVKKQKNGVWPLQNRHPGKTFFEMEKTRQPSRWNTLRGLRILNWWDNCG